MSTQQLAEQLANINTNEIMLAEQSAWHPASRASFISFFERTKHMYHKKRLCLQGECGKPLDDWFRIWLAKQTRDAPFSKPIIDVVKQSQGYSGLHVTTELLSIR